MKRIFTILMLVVSIGAQANSFPLVQGVVGGLFLQQEPIPQLLMVLAMAHTAHHANLERYACDAEYGAMEIDDFEWVCRWMIAYISAEESRKMEQLYAIFRHGCKIWRTEAP